MKIASTILFFLASFAWYNAEGLQPSRATSRLGRNIFNGDLKSVTLLRAGEREDLVPETSFGAEVVPEGQRPVNEYLEMRRSPLFEWASNEAGTKGVSHPPAQSALILC